MREREPVTQTLKASQARQQWSQLLNRVFRRETRVLVEKSGIPVAAIVSADDLERLERLEERRRQHFAAIEAFGEPFKDESPEESERQAAKAVAAARAQRRKAQRPAATSQR